MVVSLRKQEEGAGPLGILQLWEPVLQFRGGLFVLAEAVVHLAEGRAQVLGKGRVGKLPAECLEGGGGLVVAFELQLGAPDGVEGGRGHVGFRVLRRHALKVAERRVEVAALPFAAPQQVKGPGGLGGGRRVVHDGGELGTGLLGAALFQEVLGKAQLRLGGAGMRGVRGLQVAEQPNGVLISLPCERRPGAEVKGLAAQTVPGVGVLVGLEGREGVAVEPLVVELDR